MFANKSKVESYEYNVNLGKPVDFFCNLINDIGENIVDGYKFSTLFKKDFIVEIGYRFHDKSTLGELISYIASYYTSYFLECIDISMSNILFIYKVDKLLFSYGSDQRGIKTTLTTLLIKEKIFDKLISHVENDKLRLSLEKLQSIKFSELFHNVIEVGEKRSTPAPYVPFDFFDQTSINEEVIDELDLSFNVTKLKRELAIEVGGNDLISLININTPDGDPVSIAIKCNNIVFPLTSRDLRPFIEDKSVIDYCWLLFKEVFQEHHERNRNTGVMSELLSHFKNNMRKTDLSQLLSHLEQNHRIAFSDLDKFDKYNKYFEEVSKIKDLNEMKNFEFYVSNKNGSTVLGIFCREKIKTNYNLLHWIKNNGNNNTLDYYKNIDQPKSQIDEKVFVFKPEIAFYFITNYFEDFLENILIDTHKEYISNFKLYIGNEVFSEIDFLVKSNNKLCFIEAKTKLSNDYIEQCIEKCEKLLIKLKSMNLNCEIEFYLISAFSDSSCENKKYFINESKKKGYNNPREGINTIPYYFKVPIPRYKNSKLICIAEPDYKKIKKIISKI